MSNLLLDAALAYAERGWRVFPVKPASKAPPLIPEWQIRATVDPVAIASWWHGWPLANIGLATGRASGLLVLDVDPRHDGDVSLSHLEAKHGPLPPTTTSITPGKGQHYLFRCPNAHIGNVVGLAGLPGLDIRCDGGYIVAPPSPRTDGAYAWDTHPDDVPPADPPPWLLSLIGTDARPTPAPATTERVPHGQRHAALVSLAGSLAKHGADEDTIYAAVVAFYQNRCAIEPPAPDKNLRAIARYAASKWQEPLATHSPTTPNPAFSLIPWRDLDPDLTTKPLVRGWLEPSTLAVLYGQSNAGKSFLALDLAFHVAAGRPWFGLDTAQGPTVYIACEAPASIIKRAYAAKLHHASAPQDTPLYIAPHRINLISRDDPTPPILSAISPIGRPALIVVDTAAAAMPGGDENASETMGLMVSRLAAIRDATRATVLLVHHAGKDETKGARGHSSLKAAIDTEIEVRLTGDAHIATLTKARDGQIGHRVGFELSPVEVAILEDGSPLEIPVVLHLRQQDVRLPLTGRRLDLYHALVTAYQNNGERPVSMDAWRSAYLDAASARLSVESARQAFHRVYRQLIPVWVAGQPAGPYVPAGAPPTMPDETTLSVRLDQASLSA